MKNDPYFKLIAACIVLGLLLALVSTHVHAAVPLPPIHVMAKAPHWEMVMNHPAVKAFHLTRGATAVVPTALPPAMPAPVALDVRLGT
jgi:hypothetical protein